MNKTTSKYTPEVRERAARRFCSASVFGDSPWTGWFGPAPSGGGEDAGPMRWRSLLVFSPPLALAYSGRSENQHSSIMDWCLYLRLP